MILEWSFIQYDDECFCSPTIRIQNPFLSSMNLRLDSMIVINVGGILIHYQIWNVFIIAV